MTTSYTDFTAASLNISLNPSIQYFLVIKGVSLSDSIGWGYTGTSFPFTSYYSETTNGGSTWSGPFTGGPMLMRIQASSSSDVPEPASLGLVGAGLAGWFASRRRAVRPA